jgi:hypothetical protein
MKSMWKKYVKGVKDFDFCKYLPIVKIFLTNYEEFMFMEINFQLWYTKLEDLIKCCEWAEEKLKDEVQ